jgi:hypothetical protein
MRNGMKEFEVLVWGECHEIVTVLAQTQKGAIAEVKKNGFGSKRVVGFGSTEWDDIRGVEEPEK